MRRARFVYATDKLDELPVGTVVQAHRRLAGRVHGSGTRDHPYTTALVPVLVRQPNGWFGAWDCDLPTPPADLVPCTILYLAPVRPDGQAF